MTMQQCPCLQAMRMNREVDPEFDPELLQGEFETSDQEFEAGDFEFETEPEFETADQEFEAGDFEFETEPEFETADQEFEAGDFEFETADQEFEAGDFETDQEFETFDREDAFETWLGEVAKPLRFLKDNPSLQQVSLTPPRPIRPDPKWGPGHKKIAATYNRIGGLLSTVATKLKIDPAAVLAVWMVESGGRREPRGRPLVRFENHVLYKLWGKNNPKKYSAQFKHGGEGGQPGKGWENHMFRTAPGQAFRPVHDKSQDTEHAALRAAAKAAGSTVALQSASLGGAQILGYHHKLLGYATPLDMYRALKAGERADVLGFFDFCRNRKAPKRSDLIRYLRNRDWRSFAQYYNGPGLIDHYAPRLAKAYEATRRVLAPAGAPQKELYEYV